MTEALGGQVYLGTDAFGQILLLSHVILGSVCMTLSLNHSRKL